MANTQAETRKYWLFAMISFVFTVLLLIFANSWFWVGLPFFLTSLVLAFDKL